MHYEGTIEFPAPRGELFDLLLDPEVMYCLPGVESVAPLESEAGYQVVSNSDLGLVSHRFDLTVRISISEPPDRARLSIAGKGAGSHVGATSDFVLYEKSGLLTEMHWDLTFTIYGRLVSLGSRVIDQAFATLHRRFINNVQTRVVEQLG